MSNSNARHSAVSDDGEATPLIGERDHDEPVSFRDRVSALTKEPLTPLLKLLLVVVIILLLLSATFIGLFAGAEHKLKSRPPAREPVTTTVVQTATVTSTVHSQPTPSACYTRDCIVLSADILSGLDTTQDPCENFYDFVNGGWLQSHPLPADKPIIGTFTELAKDNKAIIRELVTTPSDGLSDADIASLTKIKTLYDSCADESTLNSLGAQPLHDLVKTLRDILHGKDVGPLVAGSTSPQAHFADSVHAAGDVGKHPWTGAVAFAHSRGVPALFGVAIDGDAGQDPDHMVPVFSQPELGLPSKEYFEEEELVAKYEDTLEQLLYALDDGSSKKQEVLQRKAHFWPPWPWPPWNDDDDGADNRTTRAKRLAKAVVTFETRLANASADNDYFADALATYNPVALKVLQAAIPQIDFPAYFATFAVRKFPAAPVILSFPPFAAELGWILSNTSTETLEAYLVTRVALTHAPLLSYETAEWKAVRELREAVYGLKKGAVTERSEWCIDQVERQLGYAVGRFFVQKAFGGDSREKGVKVIHDIIGAFKNSLEKLEWMDKADAKLAAEKADNLAIKVGGPLNPNTWSDTSIASYYNTARLHDGVFFDNVLQTVMLSERIDWSLLGQRRDRRRWLMSPSTVNAYFEPPANEIVFPAGILQPPFFSAKFPGYLNYGGFGMVAAHELTHAFDSAGRMYDQNGRLREWWHNSTSDAFDERAKCLADQYSNYTVHDGKGHQVPINGNLTSGENIGDTGLIQAWRAWKAQYDEAYKQGDEYLLPGLNMTREQLFFVSFGRVWAQNLSPAAALQRIRVDPHSPNRYRVEGTVYNVPEFAEAFKCRKGAKLNPPKEKQCRFW
ncbi:zincin [Auriculariales sp. MPI-PUGE-AT-0066]|nr:zincin [Auriculariales sp. MPI-PUGE-AT-0066]